MTAFSSPDICLLLPIALLCKNILADIEPLSDPLTVSHGANDRK